MPRSRVAYPPEFRQEMVELVHAGRSPEALAVPIEALLGLANGAAKRGATPKLQKQLERIAQLPRAQQRVVMQMLDGVLAQTSR